MIDKRLLNVIVPLDEESLNLIFRLEENTGGIYEHIELSREDLDTLLLSGAIDEINKHLDLKIEDYEEEKITDKDTLEKLLQFIKKLMNKYDDTTVLLYLDKIAFLTQKAIDSKTGIFFHF